MQLPIYHFYVYPNVGLLLEYCTILLTALVMRDVDGLIIRCRAIAPICHFRDCMVVNC